MRFIVQKFGGSSVDTRAKRERVAERVGGRISDGYTPLVVVSAMGRRGQPYATDSLLDLAREANPAVTQRDLDLLVSCGELISAVLVAQALKVAKIAAMPLSGAQAGLITDEQFGRGAVEALAPDRILQLLQDRVVPVVAGFQGITRRGEVTTLGRGASNATASVLGAAIGAEAIEIHSDVEGVYTADPRLVADAKLIRHVDYAEACELAYKGAKVMHPQALEIAERAQIPVQFLSARREGDGTLVHAITHARPVTAVTSRSDVTYVELRPSASSDGAELAVFRVLAAAGVSVDFISVRPGAISFIVDRPRRDEVARALASQVADATFEDRFVKVSVVGSGMRGIPGVFARVVDALSRRGIAIYRTSDSHTAISCLVDAIHEALAGRSLHAAFDLASEDAR